MPRSAFDKLHTLPGIHHQKHSFQKSLKAGVHLYRYRKKQNYAPKIKKIFISFSHHTPVVGCLFNFSRIFTDILSIGSQSVIDRFCQIFSFLQRHPTQRLINIPIQIIGPQHPVTILLCIFFFSNNSILALASCSDDRLKRSLPVKLRLLSPLFCPAWMIWLHSCRRYSSRIANTSSVSCTHSLRIRKLTRSLC